MKSIKQSVQDHPVGAFFLLAFAIAWLGSILAAGPKFFRGEEYGALNIGMIGFFMLAGPIVAGILTASIVDGKRGIRDMFRRMKIWRVGKWYLTVLIFPALILIVSLGLSVAVSPGFAPIFLIGYIVPGIMAGFIEETGWMGFAFPRMKEKHGPIRAGVYLGLLHGLWHLPVWFLIQSSDLGILWYPYFLAFVVFLVALRVIMVWAYSHTNSLLLAQLIHASSTGFLAVLTPDYVEPVHWIIFYAVYAVVLGVVALVVVRKTAGSSV